MIKIFDTPSMFNLEKMEFTIPAKIEVAKLKLTFSSPSLFSILRNGVTYIENIYLPYIRKVEYELIQLLPGDIYSIFAQEDILEIYFDNKPWRRNGEEIVAFKYEDVL